jgi:hypothetical protein
LAGDQEIPHASRAQTIQNIDLTDSFFDSLKKDYAEFSQWFAKKAEERAYVFPNEQGSLEGFLYLKTEDGPLNESRSGR